MRGVVTGPRAIAMVVALGAAALGAAACHLVFARAFLELDVTLVCPTPSAPPRVLRFVLLDEAGADVATQSEPYDGPNGRYIMRLEIAPNTPFDLEMRLLATEEIIVARGRTGELVLARGEHRTVPILVTCNGTSSVVSGLEFRRAEHAAALLGDGGQVVAAGGVTCTNGLCTPADPGAVIFDADGPEIRELAISPRVLPAVVRLEDGSVLIAAGWIPFVTAYDDVYLVRTDGTLATLAAGVIPQMIASASVLLSDTGPGSRVLLAGPGAAIIVTISNETITAEPALTTTPPYSPVNPYFARVGDPADDAFIACGGSYRDTPAVGDATCTSYLGGEFTVSPMALPDARLAGTIAPLPTGDAILYGGVGANPANPFLLPLVWVHDLGALVSFAVDDPGEVNLSMRAGATAAVFPDGRVLMVGGVTPMPEQNVLTVWVNAVGVPDDPPTLPPQYVGDLTSLRAPSLVHERLFATATVLGSGKVVVLGGRTFSNPVDSVGEIEILDIP